MKVTSIESAFGLCGLRCSAASNNYYSVGASALNSVPDTMDGCSDKSICDDLGLWVGTMVYSRQNYRPLRKSSGRGAFGRQPGNR